MTQEEIFKIDLFDLFREFFDRTASSKWDKIDPKEKKRHSFMLKRYLSIKHPELIQFLNRFDSAATIDAIRFQLVKPNTNKYPGWMYQYAKAKKQGSVDVAEALNKFDPQTISNFMSLHMLSKRDMDMCVSQFFDDTMQQLNQIEEQLNKNAKPSKSRRR